jgi:hypothetical protein
VTRDTDRDFIMTAEQAREYGIVDDIITARDGSLTRGRRRPAPEGTTMEPAGRHPRRRELTHEPRASLPSAGH